MSISNIIKHNRATKELKERLANNIQSTSDLVKAILPEDLINEHETQINEALQNYESQNQRQDTEKKNTITFKYPEKTLQQAELDYCRTVREAELEFGRVYAAWNEQMYTAHQERVGERDGAVRIQAEKPYYIAPADTVVKVGQTHFELQFVTRRNPTTQNMEIQNQSMEILERRETNDINMEDNCIKYEGKDKTAIDWETTLQELKEEGEKLGYGKHHFLKCLLRILSQHDLNLFEILKMEKDPEKIANNLLAKYKTINKKRVFENMLKALTRKRGQSIREVMCQADSLTDRILVRCKTPEERAFRKYQLMLDALKSFSSEENAKELVMALKGSALTGERPEMHELIDTVELAERINESSRPTKDQTFMNEGTVETCEIFAVNPGEGCNNYTRPRMEFPNRSAQHHYGTRSRSKENIENNIDNVIRKIDEMNLRGRSQDRKERSNDRSNGSSSPTRNQSNWRGRTQIREDRRHRERGSSQDQYEGARRSWSSDRNRGGPGHSSVERIRRQDRNNGSQNRQNGPRERLRESYGNRTYSRERSNDRSYRDRRYSGDRYNYNRNERYQAGRDQSRDRNGQTAAGGQSGERWSQQRGLQSYNRRDHIQSADSNSRYRNDRRQSGERHDNYREQSRERYGDNRRQSGNRYGYRSRERSRQGRERYDQRQRSQSKEAYKDRRIVPFSKRNLEGIEFPLIQQMDLSSKYCVKCMNSIEEHYPWDCKLFRYYSPTPCDICYNGQHRAKECRKNPNRVDAFSIMLEGTQTTAAGALKQEPTYSPF